jgi:hypothetical protein
MSEIGDGIQYLYSKFIMRDLLSFVTPGAIIVGTLFLIHWDFSYDMNFFKSIPYILYIPSFGVLYIVGFAVQCLGAEFFPIIKFHYYKTDIEHYRVLAELQKRGEKAIQQHERFVVLKQMCGNGGFAIFIAGVLLIINLWIPILSSWALGIMVLLLIISLFKGHYVHVQRQKDWEDVFYKSSDNGQL